MDYLVEVENLSIAYENQLVLRDITLNIEEGDFLGIIGPNGGGKTTLLKALLGLVSFHKGTIRYNLKGGGNAPRLYGIGYLPQIKNFDQQFPITVQDIVLSGLMKGGGWFSHFSRDEKKRASLLLERLGISRLAHRSLNDLSGGLLQRVFLARALIGAPRLLLLDEPNTFVDKDFENHLYQILKDLHQKEGISIVLVTHDIGVISSYVKNIACVNGTLFYHGGNEMTEALVDRYNCPIDIITHGVIPHRVLKRHDG